MFSHRRSACTFYARVGHRPECFGVYIWVLVLLCPLLVLSARQIRAAEVETEHLFGFTTGSDVGKVGGKEVESETPGGFGKRAGSYAAISQFLEAKSTPVENLRVLAGVAFAHHDISDVRGLDDRRQTEFQGVAFGMRYRLADPERALFGLTIGAEPHWNRVEEISGEPVDQYGTEFSIAVDKELVANRIYAAFNVLFEPNSTRSRITGEWQQKSITGVSAALTAQVRTGIFVGAEVRYLRRYESSSLETITGQAVFVGPTMYAQISRHFWVSAAWSVQVAGRASNDPAALDLVNFERHQAMLRLGYNF
jgi:hypothetical protein